MSHFPHSLFRPLRSLCALGLIVLLAACAAPEPVPAAEGLSTSAWARACQVGVAESDAGAGWHHFKLPGKSGNAFTAVHTDGRDAMLVQSNASASMLRHKLQLSPAQLGRLEFSWKVPQLIAGANMADRDADDSPVRVVLAFDGDRSRLSGRNQMLSELARALTGEDMPYATLMYVWANEAAPGSVIVSPRTDRIRQIVVESGPARLNQWLHFERNIREDFERAYGEAPGRLIGVGVMTDSDNTQGQARAWYGPIQLRP